MQSAACNVALIASRYGFNAKFAAAIANTRRERPRQVLRLCLLLIKAATTDVKVLSQHKQAKSPTSM